MKVLVACEFSDVVGSAFRKKGHNVVTCDFLESDGNGFHLQGDVKHLLKYYWDLIIAHPSCTYLCNSGVRWLVDKNGIVKDNQRYEKMRTAAGFFMSFLYANARYICVENPIPHKYALAHISRKYDQLIQPWQYGHGETKATCLWLKGLPKLKPTNIVKGREARIHKLPPSKDRGKLRSVTFQGIADAMACQWG